jgi:hypothetical protein
MEPIIIDREILAETIISYNIQRKSNWLRKMAISFYPWLMKNI